MKYLHFDLPMKRVSLYPLGDWHYGSRQCDDSFIQKVVAEIKSDPQARWVGLGDLIENAIVGSKSDVYLQTCPPKEQIDHVVKLLEPIKEKCLFMIPGNHEERTMRVVGLHPDEIIAGRLWVPYVGYSCLMTLDLTEAKTPRSFSCYFHHNSGGGYTAGGKVNAAAKLRLIVPTVDATFSAHLHTTGRTPVKWYEPGYKRVVEKVGYDYIIGSALTWNESYAEEKAKRPAVVEQIKVTFVGATNGRYDNRKQIFEVVQPQDEAWQETGATA